MAKGKVSAPHGEQKETPKTAQAYPSKEEQEEPGA